jgi:ketosteroid isomerase-like protein
MSDEQVEVVRKHIEAYRRQDPSVALSFMDPHAVLDMTHRRFRSESRHEAIDEAVTPYVGAFEDYAYEVERLTELGAGAIIAVVTETGRGKGSGVPANRRFATLYTVIDGKIARVTQFRSEQDALGAAGLQE